MKLKEKRAALNGNRTDEFHRPPTRFERFRAWVERLPRMRLYVAITAVTWISLTGLIGLDDRPLTALGFSDNGQDYQVGAVSDADVYAPRSVTYTDPTATEEARQEAADAVAVVYRESSKVPADVEGNVKQFFDKVRKIRASDKPAEQKTQEISDASPSYLPQTSARALVFVDDKELENIETYVTENLQEMYASTAVADDTVEEVPASVVRISEARNRLSEAAVRDASGEEGALVEVLSREFVEPNYVVDRAATQKARDEAASKVGPVKGSIKQGERILARGEVIDRQAIAQLQALSIVRDTNPWTVILGVALVVAAEMGVAWYFLERFGKRILRNNAMIRIVLAASLTILFTLLARGFVLLSLDPYLIPLAGLSIIGTILLGPRLMFLMVVISAVNVGIIGGNDFLLSAALLLTSGFAIYTVVRVTSRQQLLKAGLFIAVVMAGITFAVSLVGGSDLGVALQQGALGLGNGLLSLMIAMMLLPLLEDAFNILTPMKLLELSDPGNELLQKLLRTTPGTFSHSMQVGNLAENAAERIGADTLLARVGAYYHDVGKMEHPAYFIENQIAQVNPHATLSPALSARVIKRHVKDGLEIGRMWGLPQEILDIIAQHHGTTRIEYFFRKARDLAPDPTTVRESEFRYSGGRPRSKEAGIVMIADSVEATVKSIAKPTPKRIEDVVSDTIRHKLEDGQFDECELTMQEIHAVGEAILEALIGFLGPRIEYPEATPAEKKPPVGQIAGKPAGSQT
ncbi:MAG TPA: HDIG domain-containing protein [Rubrobacteraceae bacterium]|nr:HDIG domain-containing protein [Rubrobacteraceae bacterium]